MLIRLCRLPSRMAWFIRVLHFLLSLGILLTLLLQESILHYMLVSGADVPQGCIYLTLFIMALFVYFVVSFMDPGYLQPDKDMYLLFDRVDDDSEDDEDEDIESGPKVNDRTKMLQSKQKDSTRHLRFCKECLHEQPLRCRHCVDCGRCVLKFDHHCPWIDNCVGERNHALFLLFMLVQSVVIWWTFRIVWYSILSYPSWRDWFLKNSFYLADLIVLAVSGTPLTCLLVFHLYLAVTNSTTWETTARERISYLRYLDHDANPFHQGYLRNLSTFCCSRFPYRWDRIYRSSSVVSDTASRTEGGENNNDATAAEMQVTKADGGGGLAANKSSMGSDHDDDHDRCPLMSAEMRSSAVQSLEKE